MPLFAGRRLPLLLGRLPLLLLLVRDSLALRLRRHLPLLGRSRLPLLLRRLLSLLGLRGASSLLLPGFGTLLPVWSRLPLLLKALLPLLLSLLLLRGRLIAHWLRCRNPYIAIRSQWPIDGHAGGAAMIHVGELGAVGTGRAFILYLGCHRCRMRLTQGIQFRGSRMYLDTA